MIQTTSVPPINRKALTGFIVSMLALLSFCAGFVPIPFTAIICYPTSILLGVVALVVGLSSTRQIRLNGENGKAFALISVWVGGFVIFVTICFITIGILLLPHIYEFIKQNWHHLNLNSL